METCPDAHHCLNGSKCIANPYDEGSYYCDCEEVVFEARYEGLYCEHKAEVYCIAEGVHKHSFCTNDGICLELVGPQEAHVGCKCPSAYEGSHCQFVKGSKPEGWPFTSNQAAIKKGSTAGGVIASVVVAMAVAVVAAAFAYRQFYAGFRFHSGAERSESVHGDGGKMKKALELSMVSSVVQTRIASGNDNKEFV